MCNIYLHNGGVEVEIDSKLWTLNTNTTKALMYSDLVLLFHHCRSECVWDGWDGCTVLTGIWSKSSWPKMGVLGGE